MNEVGRTVGFPAPRREYMLLARGREVRLGRRTLVMGVINCTPDSFSDGGKHLSPADSIGRLEEMVKVGADWVDVGGESSRPGSLPVPAEEEWSRIRPVLEEARRSGCPLPISVDTMKAEVAERALELGVSILNDISGLRFNPEIGTLAAESGAALVLMQMKGMPRTMQTDPTYQDLIAEVSESLHGSTRSAVEAGVAEASILCDPGIGFGKSVGHNLELIRRLPDLASVGFPLLVGASRKSFLGKILDVEVDQRLEGSLSAHVAAVIGGAHVVRTHDVRATARAVAVADAIRDGVAFTSDASSV